MFTPGALPGAGAAPLHLRFGVRCHPPGCRPHDGHISVRLPRPISNALFEPPKTALVFGDAEAVPNGLLSELPNLGMGKAKSAV